MKHFGDIVFTSNVKAEQERRGSRDAYAAMTARPAPDGLTAREASFIEARDSFYLASVTEDGWPYVQHRGGPAGFLKVIDTKTLGFADYRGNRQYVSTGNFVANDRASLFLMDYPNRARLKIIARARVEEAADNLALAAALGVEGGGKVERLFLFDIEAFDWNCPQFITPRFTQTEIETAFGPKIAELEALKEENAKLKEALAARR